MTHNMQEDCMTWNRTEPPANVQAEINDMARRPSIPVEEPIKSTRRSRKPGIGERKNYGYTVPDTISGSKSGESDGSVKEAMFGWRDHHTQPKHPGHKVTFEGARPDSCTEVRYEENMFDLLAHTGLAENNMDARAQSASNKNTKPSGPKLPKDPRKNQAYINRTNAISQKYNQVDHKPWKMPRFENIMPRVSSKWTKSECKQDEFEQNHIENPLMDAGYPGLDGKLPSRQSPAYVSSRMELQPPVGEQGNNDAKLTTTDDQDMLMFDV